VQIPIGSEALFRGVVDLIEEKAYYYESNGTQIVQDVPADLLTEMAARREKMIEQLADLDDEMAEVYLEGSAVNPSLLREVLRRIVLRGAGHAVLCGSALHNKAIQPLLDAIVAYLPSPRDVEAMHGASVVDHSEVLCASDPAKPMAALVFKVNTDPYVGRLAYVRVYDGILRRGDAVVNPKNGRKERIGRLVRMHADHRADVEEIGAGDIGAILGLKVATTGETLCAPDRQIILEEISFPAPVMHLAIEPKTKADQDRLSASLSSLIEEDPTLRVHQDEHTGQTILSGMGELHLDVMVDRLRREFHVAARVGQPQVAYCETITRPAAGEGRLVRQSGGRGQFAIVMLELEPLPSGAGIEVENALVGGAIPKQFVPAVEAGIQDAVEAGVLLGQPLVDMKIRIVDGRFHEVDSSERAFRTAASMAVKECVLAGAPVILQPIMKIEVVAPEPYLGDVIGDLSSRKASITGLETRPGGVQSVTAHVPLAGMFGYATALRSRTQGRGNFVMEFDHYAAVPPDVAGLLLTRP